MHTTSTAMTFRGMARSHIAIRISTNRSRTATRISPIFITGIGIDLVTMGYRGDAHIKVAARMENTVKKLTTLATLIMTISIAGTALAHGDRAEFDGIVQSVGNLKFEMVKKNAAAIIFVQNHGKKFSTAGAKGVLTVMNGAVKTEVPLQPSGDNAMETKGDVKLAPGAKTIAAITFADNKTVTVNFLVK